VRTIARTNIVYVISWDICFQIEVGFEQRWIEKVILVINEVHASKKINLKKIFEWNWKFSKHLKHFT